MAGLMFSPGCCCKDPAPTTCCACGNTGLETLQLTTPTGTYNLIWRPSELVWRTDAIPFTSTRTVIYGTQICGSKATGQTYYAYILRCADRHLRLEQFYYMLNCTGGNPGDWYYQRNLTVSNGAITYPGYTAKSHYEVMTDVDSSLMYYTFPSTAYRNSDVTLPVPVAGEHTVTKASNYTGAPPKLYLSDGLGMVELVYEGPMKVTQPAAWYGCATRTAIAGRAEGVVAGECADGPLTSVPVIYEFFCDQGNGYRLRLYFDTCTVPGGSGVKHMTARAGHDCSAVFTASDIYAANGTQAVLPDDCSPFSWELTDTIPAGAAGETIREIYGDGPIAFTVSE